MEGLILFYLLVCYLVKNVAEDTWHGIKGTESPRHQRQRERRRHRQKSRSWAAVAGWWADLVEDATAQATENRRRKAAERRQAQAIDVEPVPEPAAIDDAVVVHPPDPEVPAGRAFWDLGPRDCTVCGEPGAMVQRPTGRTFTHDRTGDRCPALEPDPQGDPIDLALEDNTTDNVIPFRSYKEKTMTATANTEVTGLTPALAYVADIARFAAEHSLSGAEGYVGFLEQSEVSGQAIASAHEMQEAFGNAAAAAERHRKHLEAQTTVQEAYANNPDAGSKQFMTNGQ